MVFSQNSSEEMYKLTYDSEDNDEINAPSTLEKRSKSSSDAKMKADAEDVKENGNGEVFSPKQKRKSVGTYEGNGRYYSLFSNDNFVTEDKSNAKKKCCRVGVKSGLLIVTVIVLALGILGLMWVVRGLQVEQEGLIMRIEKLENGASFDSASALKHPYVPLPSELEAHGQQSTECCKSNGEQISYLNDVLRGHESRFLHIEEKIQVHKRSSDVRDAQITRLIAEKDADVKSALSLANSVKHSLNGVKKTVDSAKSLALLTLKEASLTDEQIAEYVKTLGAGSNKRVAFGVAHAMGSHHIAPDTPNGVMMDFAEDVPPLVYDVGSEVSPILSFTERLIDGGAYIQPESGTFTVPETGNYYLSISFCVGMQNDVTLHLLRNGEILREFIIAGSPSLPGVSAMPAVNMHPPPGAEQLMSEDDYIAIPPLPFGDSQVQQTIVKPYHFADVSHFEQDDDIQLKIVSGRIEEFTHFPGSNAAKSCTRFSGFKL